MAWRKIDPEDQETVYESNAADATAITHDLKIVIDRLIENKTADNASAAENLYLFVNATNSYIMVAWYNKTEAKLMGDWIYYMDLNALGEKEDAFLFDQECYDAIWDYTEEHTYDDEGNSLYGIFIKTELTEIKEILI